MRFTDYPFTSRFIERRGIRQHYLDEGPRDGQPIVMLHGNPTWSYYYRRLVLALRDRYRVIVPDHVGMGLSDKPGDADYDYTLTQRVDDLTDLLNHLGVGRDLSFVVHDWGGMIGMAYAVDHADEVARLVILNTAAFHLPGGKTFPWQLAICRHRLLGPLAVRGLNAFCRGAIRDCVVRRPLSADVRQAYLAPYDSWKNRRAVHRFVQDIPLEPTDPSYELVGRVAERLPQLADVPTLVCWGADDFVFDAHFLAEWRRRLPGAEFHEIARAGHYVLEDAGDEVLGLIGAFLEKHPLATAVSGADGRRS